MRSRLAVTAVLLGALFVASGVRGDTGKPTVDSIGQQVVCRCGCVTTMDSCPHKDNRAYVCYPTWQGMKALIQKEAASGKDETAILQAIAIRYGVQVLAAPPAKGFNLAVWILPGIGLLVGLGFVVVIVRRWRRKPAPEPSGAAALPPDPKVVEAMEEEMKSAGLGVRD